MRAAIVRLLQALLVWLAGPTEAVVLEAPAPAIAAPAAKKPAVPAKPDTALRVKARDYVRWADTVHGEKDGEFKRHQVLAKLLKDFPAKTQGHRLKLSRAIDDAVEQL